MIYEMFGDLRDALHARQWPTHFEYGPERTHREGHQFSNLIVIERDRDQTDTLEAAHGQNQNPRKRRTRRLAVKATIFACSTLPGAHVGEHEKVCEALVDALLVQIEDWGTETGAGDIPIVEARYVSAADRSDVETWPGVVYQIRFRVGRGMRRLDYTGQGLPVGAVSHARNVVEVSENGGEDHEDVPAP